MKNIIWITSTARKITEEEVKPAMELLEQWGFTPVLSSTIGAEKDQYAGDDALRTAEFQKAMDNPEVKAIWCARGGYGTVRIIDRLDFSRFVLDPKPIIGYSDVTVLHSHLHNLGLWSVHATMPINIKNNSDMAIESLRMAIMEEDISYELASAPENRSGKASGKLIGGNLSILYSLCGSRTSLDTAGKILFIEDVDEYLYHIDRMMVNLKRNGYFEGLNGLIVGNFTKMHDNTIPFGKDYKTIILDAVKDYQFPVMFDFPAGHSDDNRALIIGNEVEMEITDKRATLVFK